MTVVHFDNIPKPLHCLEQWVLWRYEERDGKTTKVPRTRHGGFAKTNDSSTWDTFDAVRVAYERGGFSGVGICFAPGDGLFGVDLDKCIDEDGVPTPAAREILEQFSGTYTEVSPSGNGYRIFGYGKPARCGKGGEGNWIEVYDHSSPRYLTVTGDACNWGRPLRDGQDALDWLYARHMHKPKPERTERQPRPQVQLHLSDQDLVDRARAASNGSAFSALYDNEPSGDHSSDDMALCNMLAFWTGRDEGQMDRLFRASALMRDKWDSPRMGSTYGGNTIARAIADCREVYSPARPVIRTETGPGMPGEEVVVDLAEQRNFRRNGEVSQDRRSGSAKVKTQEVQGASQDFGNFRNFRNIFQMTGSEVDPLPILPERPGAAAFPSSYLDPIIVAVQDRSQAPFVLCAQSVLAAITLAVQHLANVEIPGIGSKGALRPISNFFLTIARSGERKSSVDRIVLEGVQAHQVQVEMKHEYEHRAYMGVLWDYQKKERQLKGQKDGGSYEELGDPPDPPREPLVLIKEPTQEGLFRSLAKGQLSQGLFNDEGGTFIGGYGMSKDHRMRTAATFNALWDGAKLDRPRAKEHESIRNRRFTVHLMLQPKASEQLIGDSMLGDLGFLARCLVAEPESTIGTRLFKEPGEKSIRLCDAFHRCIRERMELEGKEDSYGLTPRTLPLSGEARQTWIDFYNEIEQVLPTQYANIQGFASKTPEHSIRIAATLALFDNANVSEISGFWMQTGIDLARFYLSEQLRLAVGRPSDTDEAAQALLDWLHSDRWGEPVVSIADICRTGPASLRKRDNALHAVEVAVETGHLRPLPGTHEVRGKNRRQCFEVVAEEEPAAKPAKPAKEELSTGTL